MRNENVTTIDLFVASSAETLSTRNSVSLALDELNSEIRGSGFLFNLLRWENETAAFPRDGRSQDEYNKMIDECDMVAVIIENFVGKWTEEEFDHALSRFMERGAPRVFVFMKKSNADSESRYFFSKKLNELEYFPHRVENDDQLVNKLKGELIRLKEKYKAEELSSAADVEETLSRLHLDDDLTREAIDLFRKGDYSEAILALDMEKIRERARILCDAQEEIAKAFVLRARLELTNVKNRNRFTNAESLFEEALNARRTPEILFEFASYCQNQNAFKQAEAMYVESLQLLRELVHGDPDAYKPNVAATLNNLAILHKNNNELEQAEDEYNEALALYRELATSNPDRYNPNVAMTLNNLGTLHYNSSEPLQAEEEYNEALGIRRELAASNPDRYNPYVANTLNNLGALHYDNSEPVQAEKEYNEALCLYRELAKISPSVYNSAVAMTLNNLATLHSDNSERLEQAEEEYKEALTLYRKLAASNPNRYEPYVAITLHNLATLHSDNNEPVQSEEEYKEALTLYRELAAGNPNRYNPSVAMTLNNLATLHIDNDEFEQAEMGFNEALGLITPFYEKYPQTYQSDYDMIMRNLDRLFNDAS